MDAAGAEESVQDASKQIRHKHSDEEANMENGGELQQVVREECEKSTEDRLANLSKNQQKKLAKQKYFDETREDFKRKRKEKRKAAKLRKREKQDASAGIAAEGHVKGQAAIAIDALAQPKSGQKQPRRPKSSRVPIVIILDCQFDDLMTEHELVSLAAQVTRCYADNRRANIRAQLAVSSFGGRLKDRFENALGNQHGNWNDITFHSENFAEVAELARDHLKAFQPDRYAGALKRFEVTAGSVMPEAARGLKVVHGPAPESSLDAGMDLTSERNPESANLGAHADWVATDGDHPTKNDAEEPMVEQQNVDPVKDDSSEAGEIVYLTSDSDNTLHELKPYSTYIIGGLVDKNRHKGICYTRAKDKGIKTARLPIGEYLQMQSRKVLTTNHVNEIMLKWLEKGDWGQAMMEVMPKRKGGELIAPSTEQDDVEEPVQECAKLADTIDKV